MDLIVQKIKKTNQDKAQPPQKPEWAGQQVGTHKDLFNPQQPSNINNEPIRELTQDDTTNNNMQTKREEMTIITILDSHNSKSTTFIESDEDDLTTNAPIQAPMQLQAAAESTRIFQQPSPKMEHVTSDDEHAAHMDEIAYASPASAYSTAPSEIPPAAIQYASPISSLDTDDFECRNRIFDC